MKQLDVQAELLKQLAQSIRELHEYNVALSVTLSESSVNNINNNKGIKS